MRRELRGLADLINVKSGAVDKLFRAELTRVLADLEDRAAVKGTRTLTLKICFAPLPLPNGVLDSVHMEFEVNSKLPVTRVADISMIPVGKPGATPEALAFNDILANEPRQMSLDEAAQQKPGEKKHEEGA